jgi:hypothetical protein
MPPEARIRLPYRAEAAGAARGLVAGKALLVDSTSEVRGSSTRLHATFTVPPMPFAVRSAIPASLMAASPASERGVARP